MSVQLFILLNTLLVHKITYVYFSKSRIILEGLLYLNPLCHYLDRKKVVGILTEIMEKLNAYESLFIC
jgi:hypothetical protein